jgi:hypothetical protein
LLDDQADRDALTLALRLERRIASEDQAKDDRGASEEAPLG